eukprot:768210-Hanusia_phi.AAC.3
MQQIAKVLNAEFFPSKVGGRPAWLDPEHLPAAQQLRCGAEGSDGKCGRLLSFLLQIYAPVPGGPEHAFHRSIFIFFCPECCGKDGSIRALRCQLPRKNRYYSYEPPEYPNEEGEEPRVRELREGSEVDFSQLIRDKEEANKTFTSGLYREAVEAYRLSLKDVQEEDVEYLPQEVRREVSKIRSNMAEVEQQEELGGRREQEDVQRFHALVRSDPLNVKALFRRSKAFSELASREDAVSPPLACLFQPDGMQTAVGALQECKKVGACGVEGAERAEACCRILKAFLSSIKSANQPDIC